MFAIGEASRQSGVSIETIRYYEREGIVPKPARTANGRRAYSDAEIGRLRIVRRCRDLGFGTAEAVALMALSEATDASCGNVQEIGSAHLASVRRKIADLQHLEAALQELIANCGRGSSSCPLLEKLKADEY
jgi:MerR family mercuric resistance operon transcriptional regulator